MLLEIDGDALGGKNFVSASKDGQVLVCDTSTGQPVTSIKHAPLVIFVTSMSHLSQVYDLRVQDNELVNTIAMAKSGHYVCVMTASLHCSLRIAIC